jgi:hypothetical protein
MARGGIKKMKDHAENTRPVDTTLYLAKADSTGLQTIPFLSS